MANEIIKGLGFHHQALKANDFDKSLAFYEALGMKTVLSWGEGDGRAAMLDLGDGGRIELFAGGSDEKYPAAGKYMHLALRCDDVDAAYAHALSIGAAPDKAPNTMLLQSAPAPVSIRIAFVFGPSGEEIEFFRQLS